MNDNQIDELIRKSLSEERELPEGLSDRLAQYVDQLAGMEKKKGTRFPKRKLIHWASSVAAVAVLGVFIFFQTKSTPLVQKDTFDDPHQAAVATQEALALLSTQFNKGLAQIHGAGEEFDRANEIVTTQFEKVAPRVRSFKR